MYRAIGSNLQKSLFPDSSATMFVKKLERGWKLKENDGKDLVVVDVGNRVVYFSIADTPIQIAYSKKSLINMIIDGTIIGYAEA